MRFQQYRTIIKRSKFASSGIGVSAVNVAGNGQHGDKSARWSSRTALLRQRDFRNFYLGYCTSMLGTGMSRIALTFAVLDSGASATELGYVFAASVVPQVVFMIGGGVLADRLGRRPVMLITDTGRFGVQSVLAAALVLGRPALWEFVLLAALLSVGEGFFNPALGGLRADIAPRALLADANALIGVAQNAAAVLGPAIAGTLVALTSPALVIAFDAASYGVSVLALASLRIPPAGVPVQSPWRDLTESWSTFKSETWLWIITVQFALFNLFTWAPYLLLGPILARAYLGGAQAWGIVTAAFAGGSVLGGVFMVGRRRPDRPLLYAAICTLGYAIPCLMLALSSLVVAALPSIRSVRWQPATTPAAAPDAGPAAEPAAS
jgi:MFS family permease